MKFSELVKALETIPNLSVIPTQANFCRALDIKQGAMANRMKRDSEFSEDEIKKLEIEWNCKIPRDVSDTITLDYYNNVMGSCGTGTLVLSEEKTKIVLTKDNIFNYSDNNQYSVINAFGTSMQPYICDDDKLIVQHWSGEQIKDNRVYVFRYKDELFVKRLSKNIDDVIISSDNPKFEDKIIKANEDLQIVGQIVGILRNVR